MYCPKCYRLNPDENQFCSQCGHRLQNSQDNVIRPGAETKFCSHCGSEIMAAAVVCPKCGCGLKESKGVVDKPHVILDIFAFFIPLAGLIMFLCYKNNSPETAKSVGTAAVVGFLFWLLLPTIIYLAGLALT